MSATDDLASPRQESSDLMRRVRDLENASPLENASVTGGRVRFIGGLLRVDSGGRVEIVGTLEIDGTTTVTGTFSVEGPWTMSGDGTISGDVSITGDVTLTGDFTVGAGGKIRVGGMTFDPTAQGGSVDFGGGKIIHAASGYLGVYNGSDFVVFNAGGVTVSAGGRSFSIGASGVRFVNIPTVTEAASGKQAGDAFFDNAGNLFRVVP